MPLIQGRERLVRRFREFTGAWPWCWTPEQVEGWSVSGGWAHSTIRTYQEALAVFLDYLCDARYGWIAECEQRVGARPVQVCHEWNTAVHVAEYEGRPERRPLTRAELQAFFDAADDRVESAVSSRRKGWLAAFRDATLFKTVYGWGLRRREAVMLDVCDFTVNPAALELGVLGACQVRFGKAMRGSPPRRRVVATVMPWVAQALEEYLAEVRPQYGAGAHPAIWMTERAARISARSTRPSRLRGVIGLRRAHARITDMNAVSGWALGRSGAPDPGILCPGRIGRGCKPDTGRCGGCGSCAAPGGGSLKGGAGGLGSGREAPGCRRGGLNTQIDLMAVRRCGPLRWPSLGSRPMERWSRRSSA